MKQLVIVLLLMIFAPWVQAQVYKCTGTDGSVIFSDKACGSDAEILSNLDPGSSGVGANAGGPPSSLTLDDGSILRFKKIVAINVQTESGIHIGRTGMHIFYGGTLRLVEFENLVSMRITTRDRGSCGNWSQICEPRVTIRTVEREINAHYKGLRSIKLIVDDELDGTEKEMTVYFAIRNKPHIRSIRF